MNRTSLALFDHFNKVVPITQKEIDEVSPFLKTRVLLKNDFLLRSNEVCKFLAFTKTGSFRMFHIRANGDQTNIMLNSEHEFVSDLHSLIAQLPSNINIQAIEKSEITLIAKDDLNSLYETSLYWNKLGRKLTEHVFVEAKLRLEDLLYKTPEERYRDLLNNYPHFLNRYSLTDIASFIGVTPQSLSRIRTRF